MENDDNKAGEQPEPKQPPVRRKGFLKAAYQAATVGIDGKSGGTSRRLPRRTLTFTVDASTCSPGLFSEDFELTLRATSTAEEEAVGAQCRETPERAGKLIAIKMLFAVNGEPIEPGQDEWLWEALGPSGRMLVMGKINELTRPTEEARGKADESTQVSG